jgi:hypothetical protein
MNDLAEPLRAAGDLALVKTLPTSRGSLRVMYSSGVTERTTPWPSRFTPDGMSRAVG